MARQSESQGLCYLTSRSNQGWIKPIVLHLDIYLECICDLWTMQIVCLYRKAFLFSLYLYAYNLGDIQHLSLYSVSALSTVVSLYLIGMAHQLCSKFHENCAYICVNCSKKLCQTLKCVIVFSLTVRSSFISYYILINYVWLRSCQNC